MQRFKGFHPFPLLQLNAQTFCGFKLSTDRANSLHPGSQILGTVGPIFVQYKTPSPPPAGFFTSQGPAMHITINNPVIHCHGLATSAGSLLASLAGNAFTDETPAATTPPQAGQPWPGQGGIYIGTFPAQFGQPAHHLIAATEDCGRHAWGGHGHEASGAVSQVDGRANTAALLADAQKHPAALAELEAALAEKGQCLAFEPPHFGQGSGHVATVGGMVAAGLSGPARATAGAVRDYVLGARFINGLGEHLTFGGQVMKNVAGYDVSRLMAGSWGTLGLITEVSLKVLPVTPAEATLMCVGLPQKTALDLLHRWGGQPLPLNASAWVRDTTAQPVADCLFVRLRGAVAAVQSALDKMSADAVALGAQVNVMDSAEVAADWRASGDQNLPFFAAPAPDACLWRLSVPQTAPLLDLPYAPYIEWQGAQRWLWAPASAALALRELAQSVGVLPMPRSTKSPA
eukprot:gene26202-32742_t